MRLICAFALVLVAISSQAACAWNDRGHMMVAAIAWNSLDEDVKKRATELIKLNPHYKHFINGIAKPERAKVAFVMAATWPDYIKNFAEKPADAGPDDYIDHGNDPKDSPEPNRNIGYKDKFLHKYWHFKDLPFSTDGTPLRQPPEPNAETRIILHRDTLASTASDDVKSYDLVWLLHLVGDVHQPLHGVQRFSTETPNGDAGGNLVTVCNGGVCNKRLHSTWDGAARDNSSIFVAIRAAERLDDAEDEDVDIADPKKWIEESAELAKKFVYTLPIGDGAGPYHLTRGYRNNAREVAEMRIALAGARLAKLLNDFLK